MKLYLAGPMRGIPNSNYPAFIEAAAVLRSQGHEVFSPVDWDIDNHGPQGCDASSFDIRAALSADLQWICDYADAVVLLPGWENSRGARAEACTAEAIGVQVLKYSPSQPIEGNAP